MKERRISLQVNQRDYEVEVPVNRTLLQVLREDLELMDAKYGCGMGECGACTVLVDDRQAVLSCLCLASTMDGANITTVSGLADGDELHPVQEAFIEEHAIQCGYCTPGMVLKGVSLLNGNPNPDESEIRRHLEGNMCRCTGYEKIVRAVKRASQAMSQAGSKQEVAS